MLAHHLESPKDLLRAQELKVTPLRVALLAHFQQFKKPVSVSDIRAAWAPRHIDSVTLYRALHAFKDAGIVRQLSLQDGQARFELNHFNDHHHHLVCRTCGATEDVSECPVEALEKRALKKSQQFAALTEHSLEFFGTCKSCAS